MADPDVLILGAGVAGLAAARELTGAGLQVEILEARERIGGRIFTVHEAAAVPVELGAEFLHGQPPEVWNGLHEAGLSALEVPDQHLYFQSSRWVALENFWDRLENIFGRMDSSAPDQSFRQFVEGNINDPSSHLDRELATAYVEGFHAAPAERISVRSLALAEQATARVEGWQAYRLAEGYALLPKWLLGRCVPERTALRLSTVVKEVRWQAGRVEVAVQTPAGEELPPARAGRCLVTLPLGVLKAAPGSTGAVRFSPDPLSKRAAIDQLEMGAVVKLVCQFKDGFQERWRALSLNLPAGEPSFLHAPQETLPTWWTLAPMLEPVLVGWAGGPAAWKLSGSGELADRAVQQLARMLTLEEGDVRKELVRTFVHHWQADPFARGAYSFIPPGALETPEILARPLEETLFYAGEATDGEGRTGTVHGAMATGVRAAREIIALSG